MRATAGASWPATPRNPTRMPLPKSIVSGVGTCRSKPARRCSSAPFPTRGERGDDEGRRRSVAHHPALGGERIAQQLVRAEEQADLALGGVWPIGAMNDVVTDGQCVVAPNGAGGGVGGIGGAHHGAGDGDGVRALQHAGDHRSGGDERDESLIEWLTLMLGVVAAGNLARDLHELETPELEAACLEAAEDRPGEAALQGIGLDENERALQWTAPLNDREMADAGDHSVTVANGGARRPGPIRLTGG